MASDAWQRSPSESFGGLKKRLRMIPACGLPRMRVVANATLEKLGRIPRSHEGYQVDALEAVERLGGTFIENRPNAVILFYSHRWSRPNWCEALGKDLPWGCEERQLAMARGEVFGDPDDAAHSKALALVEFAKWFTRARERFSGLNKQSMPYGITEGKDLEIFWWIDWACTDQNAPGPDMAALPAYAAACAGIVAAWGDEYKNRAWCQVELLVANAYMRTGDKVWDVPPRFAEGATRPIQVALEMVVVADPANGRLTNEGDRAVIESLTDVAKRSKAFTCWRNFVNTSTSNLGNAICLNVVCCCQCFGLLALGDARTLRPGVSTVTKVTPLSFPPKAAMTSDVVAQQPEADEGDAFLERSDGLLSTGEMAGDYGCCCVLPPFGYGWAKVSAHGPDAIELWGWSCCTPIGPFCLGSEYRTRVPGTNNFRHFKDPNNVLTFSSTGARNGPAVLSKRKAAPYKFRKVSTQEIAGRWCCACVGLWFGGCGASYQGVEARGEDMLDYKGWLCWNGLPLPYAEQRVRAYFEGRPTNIFVKTNDPNNMLAYDASGASCAGAGPAYYCKCK